MNAVLKIFLSMSFSGGLLILALFSGKRFLKDKISRQWQYYIWLIVILRLLLPFGPETNLLGKIYQAVDQAITWTVPSPQYQPSLNTSGSSFAHVGGFEQNDVKIDNPIESAYSPEEDLKAIHPLQDISSLLTDHVWLIWLVAALVLLIRKITIYQSFVRYIKAGSAPVSDVEMLDRLSVIAEQSGIKKPIELCVNPLTSSPLLIGFFHPCIVLPSTDISEKDFHNVILHELTHYKRRDMFYKWLVQVTVCLHWFNPLVYLMSREITKACEFSCDEAVLAKMGSDNAQEYGKTLLDAMAAVGRYKENLGAVTLSENKRLLKERISAIMNFKKKSTAIWLVTGVLTLCIIFGAVFVGVYSVAATDAIQSAPSQSDDSSVLEEKIKNEYEALAAELAEKRKKEHEALLEELEEKLVKELEDLQEAEQEAFEGRVWHPLVYPVDQESITDGEIVWLGEYTLSEGDRIWYYIYAETGIGLQVGFASPDDELLNTTYYSVQSSDQEGEKCECIASFTFRQPVEPGTYRLFLRATDGALENVKGSISIGYKADVS